MPPSAAKTILFHQSSLDPKGQAVEATAASHILLELNHSLLVASRITGFRLQSPVKKLVGVVGGEVWAQDAKSLTILGDLGPVALDVLEVLREVCVAALKDLSVELSAHDRLEVDILLPRSVRVGQDKVSRLLDGAHKGPNLVRVLRDEGLVANVENRAEAAASEFGELVNAKHLDVGLVPALGSKPLLQLNHLHVLEADTGVNLPLHNGLGDVHAAADGRVIGGSQAVVRSELIDLNLAKLADVTDTLALEGPKVGRDSGLLEVDDAGEGFVQKAANREDRVVTGFGLLVKDQHLAIL